MASFSKACAHTSRKHVPKLDIVIPNLSDKLNTFWLYSSVFALEIKPKNLGFQSFFTCKWIFAGYFQWKTCTNFHKICSRGRYTSCQFYYIHSNFFQKFSEFFYFLKRFWWLLPTGASTSRLYEAAKVLLIPHLSHTLQVFWLQSSVFALEK